MGTAYSYITNQKMVNYTDEQIIDLILSEYEGKRVVILAPIIKSRKGHYRELFENLLRQGFMKVRVDGEIIDLAPGLKVDRYKTHDIELVVDRMKINTAENSKTSSRINDRCYVSGRGNLNGLGDGQSRIRYFSRNLMCPSSGISYPTPEPNSFSFNSPKGMCKSCKGLGVEHVVNVDKIIPDRSLSIAQGGIKPLGNKKSSWGYRQMETIAARYKFSLSDPITSIPKNALEVILHGGNESFSLALKV